MKRNQISNDPLERLFDRAREERLPDDGFSQRVLGRLEPVPPSRNLYRVPTFATAFASVLLIVWMALSGIDLSGFTERLERHGQNEGGVRLTPATWKIPHVDEKPGIGQLKP